MTQCVTPQIRTAISGDAEAIAQIHISSWHKMYKDFIPETILQNLSLQERTQQWYDLINRQVNVLIIELNNQLVGFTSLGVFHDFDADDPMGEIKAIYLHPDYWRKKLGTQLCLAAMSKLAELGYRKVFLWVFEDNMQARKFYDALGFEATSSTKLEEFYAGGALLKEVLYQKLL